MMKRDSLNSPDDLTAKVVMPGYGNPADCEKRREMHLINFKLLKCCFVIGLIK